MRRRAVLVCLLVALTLVMALPAAVGAAGDVMLWRHVIAGGGGDGTSASFRLRGTIGQPVVGQSTSASTTLQTGYWSRSSSSGPTADAVYLPLAIR